jgi:hypothetical protein
MDLGWAEKKLEEYLQLCESVQNSIEPGAYWNERATQFNRQAELMLYTVERIVQWTDSSNTEKIMPPAYSGGASKGEERVRKALGAIRDLEEIEAHMTPTAPELAADRLHPVVWKSAAVTWNTGQYRVAIGQASLALATQIKARAKSKLSDRKLVQDVFSSSPPKDGRVRLHFPGDRDEETWRSRQDGLHMLAQGVYAGIRNISAHEDEEWSEQQALEYLAVLSVVARWADETELVEE